MFEVSILIPAVTRSASVWGNVPSTCLSGSGCFLVLPRLLMIWAQGLILELSTPLTPQTIISVFSPSSPQFPLLLPQSQCIRRPLSGFLFTRFVFWFIHLFPGFLLHRYVVLQFSKQWLACFADSCTPRHTSYICDRLVKPPDVVKNVS